MDTFEAIKLSVGPREHSAPTPAGSFDATPAWVPIADLYETLSGFIFSIEVPGVTAEQLRLSVADHVLTIEGERRIGTIGNLIGCSIERCYGYFKREIRLPQAIDPRHLGAVLRHGILHITTLKRHGAVA